MPYSTRNISRSLAILTALLMMLVIVAAADACALPVWKYALWRWSADDYAAVVVHRQPLTDQQKAVVEAIEQAATRENDPINVKLHTINLDEKLDDETRKIAEAVGTDKLPRIAFFFPSMGNNGIPPLAWSGPLDAAGVAPILDSPVRRRIGRELLTSSSIVWLLIETGEEPVDAPVRQLVEKKIKALEDEQRAADTQPSEDDSVPPWAENLPEHTTTFKFIRTVQTDPMEKAFVDMLTKADPEFVKTKGPWLVPIFGRGRALAVIANKSMVKNDDGTEKEQTNITNDLVEQMTYFLCGECSCQVKEQNPGVDLLMAIGWDNLLGIDKAEVETRLPPLLSMPDLTTVAKIVVATNPAATTNPATGHGPQIDWRSTPPNNVKTGDNDRNTATAPAAGGGHSRTLVWTIGAIVLAAVIVVIIGSAVLRSKRN